MMPEEWPISADGADQHSSARAAGRGRLATVRADFFLNPRERLTEQERALMTATLHGLVGDIADDLRACLPIAWSAANDRDNAALADLLASAGLLDDPGLIALLLRCADEDRIGTSARARNGRREARMLQGLVSHDNSTVSAAAMALVLARGRRRGRFGECLVTFDDLEVPTADALVNAIAAALRAHLTSTQGAGAADVALAAASRQVLDRRDPERAADLLTGRLVRMLHESENLNDALLLGATNEGEVGFVGHALALRAGIPGDSAIDELLSGDPDRLAALLRAARASRELAAGILAAIGDLLGIRDPGTAIEAFDRMTEDQASAARARLGTPPAYRAALAALGRVHGQRSV